MTSRFAQLSQEAAEELHSLKQAKQSLTQQVEYLTRQCTEQETTITMLAEQNKASEHEKANLGEQNSKLLVSKNPQAKTQYIDKLRMELNTARKDIIKL